MAVFYCRENGTHASDDTGLLAVVYMAPSHDVGSDVFFCPSVVLSAANGITFHLCGTLEPLGVEVHVVFPVTVFSQGDSTTACIADFQILQNPSLAPVWSDESVLI